MTLDPEFIKKVQERKAKREAREARSKIIDAQPQKRSSSSTPKSTPVFKSTSMLTGETTYITGENAKDRVKKSIYNGKI